MKQRKLIWTASAIADLRSIGTESGAEAASLLLTRIRRSVLRLRTLPLSGRVAPEFDSEGLREVIVAPLRIIYRPLVSEVRILRVWHGRRDLRSSDVS